MLVVTEQIPYESLEKEGVSHRIHAYGGDNFKITLGGAQGQLVDVLIRVRHLGHILTRLVTGHEFYVRNIYVTRDIIFRSLRQPLCPESL